MSVKDLTAQVGAAIREWSDGNSLGGLFHEHRDGVPLPSGPALQEIVDLCRAILFPGFYGNSNLNSQTYAGKTVVAYEYLTLEEGGEAAKEDSRTSTSSALFLSAQS